MDIQHATDAREWDDFLARQPWTPFLQSWGMGEVYADIGQKPVRVLVRDGNAIRGICFGHIVPARRGKHLAIPYGPVLDAGLQAQELGVLLPELFRALTSIATDEKCAFIRMSPFLEQTNGDQLLQTLAKTGVRAIPSPLHLLAEHIWHLPLRGSDGAQKTEEELRAAMRKTTRNLIGRAERDGVTIERADPSVGTEHFIRLHDETRKRHGFTPYTNAFFRSQVSRFSAADSCTVYLAQYQGETIAASIHMHAFGETSYHHGASSHAHAKIPASYLLQWTAIRDALQRRDRTYNFWGIAPPLAGKNHPFAGVTLFKTGFGGDVMNLLHCHDVPVRPLYWITYGFEQIRKWRRGF